MFYGNLVNDMVILTPDSSTGRPVMEVDPPANIPTGYHAESRFRDNGSSITQVWDVVPNAGTPQDAAITLAMMQAEKLSDDEALKVPALYPEWTGNAVVYPVGTRVIYNGILYKALKTHTSTSDTSPIDSPQNWTKVLPSSSGETAPEWESGHIYNEGDRVTKYGNIYESNINSNTYEPGVVGSESAWTQITQS